MTAKSKPSAGAVPASKSKQPTAKRTVLKASTASAEATSKPKSTGKPRAKPVKVIADIKPVGRRKVTEKAAKVVKVAEVAKEAKEAKPKIVRKPKSVKSKPAKSSIFWAKAAYKELIAGLMDQGLDHADAVETLKVGLREANAIPVPAMLRRPEIVSQAVELLTVGNQAIDQTA